MACFLDSVVSSAVVKVASKIVEKKENKREIEVSLDGQTVDTVKKIPFSRKLGWLSKLQMGGAVLLAFEHVWHGEVVPWFPFLTATVNHAGTMEMLHEMATTGLAMVGLTTAVWVGMLLVSSAIEKKAVKEAKALNK